MSVVHDSDIQNTSTTQTDQLGGTYYLGPGKSAVLTALGFNFVSTWISPLTPPSIAAHLYKNYPEGTGGPSYDHADYVYTGTDLIVSGGTGYVAIYKTDFSSFSVTSISLDPSYKYGTHEAFDITWFDTNHTRHDLPEFYLDSTSALQEHKLNLAGVVALDIFSNAAFLFDNFVYSNSGSDTTPPSLVNGSPLTVAAGNTATLTANLLQYDDNVSSHAQETYSVVTGPSKGVLLKNGSATSTFTQDDIDNNRITYHETVGVSGSSSDFFTFTVTDAANNGTTLQQFQFQITPTPPPPGDTTPPSLVSNITPTIAPGSEVTITSGLLRFDDNVSSHAQEIYSITTAPSFGVLLKNGVTTSSFTQADIDNNRITYRNTVVDTSSDFFMFKVTDAANNTTASQKFQIAESHIKPVVNVHNVSVLQNASIPGLSLITSVSNPSGDNITAYEFIDKVSGGGHFVVNGASQPANTWIEVLTTNVSSIQYVGGSSPGSETLSIAVYDATTNSYSNFSDLTATTTLPPPPPSAFTDPIFVLSAFAPSAGGWSSQDRYPRTVADVNGDGKADIVAFGQYGTYVSLATGSGNFAAPAFVLSAFAPSAGGWSSQDRYPRTLADVNGDGKADIVAFGEYGTYVSLATGGGGFAAPIFALSAFAPRAGGWSSQDRYPRTLADVNGDGKADVVAFGEYGTYVSLATGGGGFAAPFFALSAFAPSAGGWSSQDRYPRTLADVNGDGKADIVAFGEYGTYVSLATGGGGFAAPIFALSAFARSAGGWSSQDRYPRTLADVNGDGKADIVAFGQYGAYVSLATGGGGFAAPAFVLSAFAPSAGGWSSQDRYPRTVADVNGDGRADIVAFGQYGTYVSEASASAFASGLAISPVADSDAAASASYATVFSAGGDAPLTTDTLTPGLLHI